MKKKVVFVAVVALLAFSMQSCGTENNSNSNNTAEPTSSVAQVQKNEVNSQQTEESDGFEKFESALDDAGYAYEVTVTAAEMVGAERGQRYTFDFGTVELYRFPEGSEALEKGEVELEGFGAFPIEVNDIYGAIIDVTENEEEITEMFNALK